MWASYRTGGSSWNLQKGLRPDLVLLDISIALLNGLDVGEPIKAKKRAIKLIYVTASDSAVVAAEAFRRGASGYVLKQDEIAELIIAVRHVVRGGSAASVFGWRRCEAISNSLS